MGVKHGEGDDTAARAIEAGWYVVPAGCLLFAGWPYGREIGF